MGVRKKKWEGSKANTYISRNKACKKLQISLPIFRRLCILKGIYPHDPKKKHRKEGQHRVYYHVRDIKHLRREPILWKYREVTAYRGKVKKYKARYEWDKLKRMKKNEPTISVDHLVRERYPTFEHALQDCDDCITMVMLFSQLPSSKIIGVSSQQRILCQRLCKEFEHYVSKKGLLKKAFISVKGIYYQAKFQNQYDITWIVPHNFTHSVAQDVDYRVMSTFLLFYQTMFKFIVFRLYKKSNLEYPPFGEIDFDTTNMSLTELREKNYKVTKRYLNPLAHNKDVFKVIPNIPDIIIKPKENINNGNNDNNNNNNNDKTSSSKKTIELDVDKILAKNKDNNNNNSIEEDVNKENIKTMRKKMRNRSNLFEDYVFLLNRETPQLSLEFIILSMKGKIIFQQNYDELIETKQVKTNMITHQIVDRIIDENQKVDTREYIQPQWVYDCLNTGIIIPTEHYQPGVQCPPHLSPFVNYDHHTHKPSQAYVLEHWKSIANSYGGFVPNSTKLANDEKRKQEQEQEQEQNDQVNANNNDGDIELNDILNGEEFTQQQSKLDQINNVNLHNDDNVDAFLNDDNNDNNEQSQQKDHQQNKTDNNNNNNDNNKPKLANIKHKIKDLKNKEKILEQQRLTIANTKRDNTNTNNNNMTKDEIVREQLAKSIMPKKTPCIL